MSEFDCDIVASWISFEAHKPRDLNEAEWTTIDTLVKQIAEGESEKYENISVSECSFDLYRVTDVREYDILAESKNYYIIRDYEDASIYRKGDSSEIVSVGDHYGNPEDAGHAAVYRRSGRGRKGPAGCGRSGSAPVSVRPGRSGRN